MDVNERRFRSDYILAVMCYLSRIMYIEDSKAVVEEFRLDIFCSVLGAVDDEA